MVSPKLQDALNEQMKNEFFSAYLYMAIAGYFQSEDLPGIASWMRVQALEEMTHGEKFYNFITDAAARTDFRAFEAPRNNYESPLDAFRYSLKHENFVTASINKLMDLAREEGNHAAQIFLQWFVTEQVEEVSTMESMLEVVRKAGEKNLLMVEAYMTHTAE